MSAGLASKGLAPSGATLTEEQIRLLERYNPEFQKRQIIHLPRDLVAVDTIKGVGEVYLQTVLDTSSRMAWGHLFTPKLPVTAVHILNNPVPPFFDEHDLQIHTVHSENSR